MSHEAQGSQNQEKNVEEVYGNCGSSGVFVMYLW